MRPRISIVTVAVDNLENALAFYRDGLGLRTNGPDESADHVAFELQNGLSFVLYPHELVAEAAGATVDGARSAEIILTHAVDTRDDVDALLNRAVAAGATLVGQPEELPWGYIGHFRDLDGHLWEIMWNPDFNQAGDDNA